MCIFGSNQYEFEGFHELLAEYEIKIIYLKTKFEVVVVLFELADLHSQYTVILGSCAYFCF